VTACLAGAAAQTTHVVGPGGSIGAVVAAATPGDIVLVSPGTYGAFNGFVGVTIRAAVPGTVYVQGACQIACPLGQTLHLVDLRFEPLTVNGGRCTFDGCVIAPHVLGPALQASNATVHLQRCTIGGPVMSWFAAPALRASSCVITAIDSTFRGGDDNAQLGTGGSAGIDLVNNSVFHGSHLTVNGGNAFTNLPPPGPAVRADGGSTVWICDSVLTGGLATAIVGSPPWTCPVAATVGRLSRCTLAPTCPIGVPTTGPMLGANRFNVPTAGTALTVYFTTDASGLVAVFASHSLGSAPLALVEQPIALDPAGAMPLALLVANATGVAAGNWILPPGVTDRAVWLQGVAVSPAPLPVSPVVGGVIR
jgi:hypothetical protein